MRISFLVTVLILIGMVPLCQLRMGVLASFNMSLVTIFAIRSVVVLV